MAPKRTFSEDEALILYNEHKNDKEIAEALGVPDTTIHSWRIRRKLPSVIEIGIHYSKVLNEKEGEEMREFLKAISSVYKTAKKSGVKPNISKLIETYRHSRIEATQSAVIERKYLDRTKKMSRY